MGMCQVSNVFGKIILPQLLTKQAINNIRFLSSDGKFTYYQKRSGSLLYSSNYQVHEMLKGPLGTQYNVIASQSRKKMIILQNENYHTFYSMRAMEKIYLANYGEHATKQIGMGSDAKLHVDDNWISYYDFYKKTLTIENTNNSAAKFNIKLNNKKNPYFSPQVVMPDENTVFYTDLGENGSFGIIRYTRNNNTSKLIYNSKTPMIKAELCLHSQQLLVLTSGINFSQEGTSLNQYKLPFDDIKSGNVLYSSPVNDIGQMICNIDSEKIYFIKNFGTNESVRTDVTELNVNSKLPKTMSELKTVTSIINMDGTLLALDKGGYFIVKGTLDFKNIDTLKSLPPGGVGEAIKNLDKQIENNE
jgi:hypothetical protein